MHDRIRRLLGPGVVGLAGVVLSLGCAATVVAVTWPPLSGDEAAHLDYAYQVWHGGLPDFEEGLQLRPPVDPLPPYQWTSQHPPLFYLLQAPVVGPLASQGEWLTALLLARGVVVLQSIGAVLAVAWLASLFGGRRRAAFAVTGAALVSPLFAFVTYSGTLYNDILALTFVALSLGVAILVLRGGLSTARVAAAAAVASAGMATRSTVVATLGLLLAALVVASLLHSRGSWMRRAFLGGGAAAVTVGAVLATSGWFYLRNQAETGSVFGGRPDIAVAELGRVRRPLLDVVTSADLWTHYRRLLVVKPEPQEAVTATVLFGTLGLLALGWFLTRRPWRGTGVPGLAQAGVLVGQVAGVVAMQAVHTSSGGGLQTRYTLMLLPVLAPVLSAGALAVPWLRAAVPLTAVVVAWVLAADQVDLAGRLGPESTPTGVPPGVVSGLAVGVAVGVALQAVAWVCLTRPGATAWDRDSAQAPRAASEHAPREPSTVGPTSVTPKR